MHSRSNIGATLKKKRQASLFKKTIYWIIFILFFISLGILGLTTNEVKIKSVIVTGNVSVQTQDILMIADSELGRYYLWIIPTDNLLLLRGKEIKNDILSNISEIGSVKIIIHGIDKIEIAVKERESKNLWCKGTPSNQKQCYFMDVEGFIFEEAPQFSVDAFPEYFGLVTEGNPIGRFYLKDNFKNASGLFGALKRMSFWPQYFYSTSEHEYEVYILGGGKLIFNDERSFESELINLQALVDNNYIKIDPASLKKIKYIDLRFGNKVNFELNK